MLSLYLQEVPQKWKNYQRYLKPIYEATLSHLALSHSKNATIILVNASEIHRLNHQYRHIDRPTDVLSFVDESEDYYGDIFINVEAVELQAQEYGHSLKREFCFLVTHGLLHLLGFDHETKAMKDEMFHLQERILDGIARRKKA